MQIKVRVLTKCEDCNGKAYLPAGETEDLQGRLYTRFLPCPHCEGTGLAGKWVELPEFMTLLEQSKCGHEHISTTGGFHLTAGEVWDDLQDICNNCGKVLD